MYTYYPLCFKRNSCPCRIIANEHQPRMKCGRPIGSKYKNHQTIKGDTRKDNPKNDG